MPVFHPALLLARTTRWLQSLSPQRPIGISTVSRTLHRYMPEYQGIVQVANGILMHIDTTDDSERGIFYAGDRHASITHLLREHLSPGACCIDLGANIGFYTLTFAHCVGTQGRVAAFEPNPAMVKRLLSNVQLNHFDNVEIVQKAVDQQVGILPFYVTKDPVLSSLSRHTENYVSKIDVEVTTLDNFMNAQNWGRLDVIKIDIEGNDCQAILSARQTIERFRPFIILEYDYDDVDPTIAETCFDFLSACRYDLKAVVLRTGRQFSFNWKFPQPALPHHVNVLCQQA